MCVPLTYGDSRSHRHRQLVIRRALIAPALARSPKSYALAPVLFRWTSSVTLTQRGDSLVLAWPETKRSSHLVGNRSRLLQFAHELSFSIGPPIELRSEEQDHARALLHAHRHIDWQRPRSCRRQLRTTKFQESRSFPMAPEN